jgi:hypothetical protein
MPGYAARAVDLSPTERAILLQALVGLRVSLSAYDHDPDRDTIPIAAITPEQIPALVRKLGGDPDDVLFGIDQVLP